MKKLPQAGTGRVQEPLHRPRGSLQAAGHFLFAHPKVISLNDRGPLACGKLIQGSQDLAFELGEFHLFFNRGSLYSNASNSSMLYSNRNAFPLLFLDGIQRCVDNTAHEVWFEWAVLVELANALKDADKRVLYHIFRHGFIVSDQERRPDCLDLVSANQYFQPPNIRMFQSVDGLNIIHSALPLFMSNHINYTDK
jgi:hypothetical protein